jgi:hypothetical protein
VSYFVVNLEREYLPDGTLHVYSPEVPGFHVTSPPDSKKSQRDIFNETALPILTDTLSRRVMEANVGKVVRIHNANLVKIRSFVPNELQRCLDRKESVDFPDQLLAQIE